MHIATDTLRDVFTALTEAHAYIAHPASITPCATKRVATHRVDDMRLLALVLDQVGDSERSDEGEWPVMMVAEEAFLAWQRVCNHLADSVRMVERLFYEAGR